MRNHNEIGTAWQPQNLPYLLNVESSNFCFSQYIDLVMIHRVIVKLFKRGFLLQNRNLIG